MPCSNMLRRYGVFILICSVLLALGMYAFVIDTTAWKSAYFLTPFILCSVIVVSGIIHYTTSSFNLKSFEGARTFCEQRQPFDEKLINGDEVDKEIYILPYCSEFSRLGISDAVNKRELSSDMRQKFKNSKIALKCFENLGNNEFEGFSDEQSDIRAKNPPDAQKFVDLVLKNQSLMNDCKHIFIASHSNFMSSLFSHLSNSKTTSFENLDVLQIVIKKNDNKSPTIQNFWHIPWKEMKSGNSDQHQALGSRTDSSIVVVTIMRHCKGCHNVTSNIFNKMFQFISGESGFLGNTNCIPSAFKKDTPDSIFTDQRTLVYQYFKKYGIPDKFCASVSLRAIFTCAAMRKKVKLIESTQQS